jgi:hypothetical protein
MKIPPFIYTRRSFVIIGLMVTLVCLMWVVSFQGVRSQFDEADDNRTTMESSESARKFPESTPKTSTSEPVLKDVSAAMPSDAHTMATLTMQKVETAIEAKNGEVLYALLSSEMKSIFTAESVTSAFAQSEGLTFTSLGAIEVDGEWAKQEVVAVDAKGQKFSYRVVLHLEDGHWTLYGTEKLS